MLVFCHDFSVLRLLIYILDLIFDFTYDLLVLQTKKIGLNYWTNNIKTVIGRFDF